MTRISMDPHQLRLWRHMVRLIDAYQEGRLDFAESVTAYLYPDQAKRFVLEHFPNQQSFQYRNYYDTARASYVRGLLTVDPCEGSRCRAP